MILVSVVVVTYNHEKYIEECLNSIINQKTNFKFEIILGEDDSKDNTRLICQNYALKYPDIIKLKLRNRNDVVYIKGKPTGRDNFIKGLFESQGKYIAFCEGDDYWRDEYKLQKQVDFLEENSEYILCHHWQKYVHNIDGNWLEKEAPKINSGYLKQSKASIKEVFKNNLRVKSRTILFRNIIEKSFFPSWIYKTAFGDVPLVFLLGRYGKFYFMNEEMASYRQLDSGVSKAGLKELGYKKFIQQHYKNWIEIWDYGDLLYNYEYHKESKETIFTFYDSILKNLPDSYKSYISLLKYNMFDRKVSFIKRLPHGLFIFKKTMSVFFKKVKKRLRSIF